MLLRSRRYLVVWVFLLLAAPLVVGMVAPDGASSILREGRTPAPNPKWSLASLSALPGEVDAYLKDHFGLRAKMIRAHKDLTKPILETGNKDVLVGRHGHLYLLSGGLIQQSAGLMVRDQRVAESADLLAAMRDALARRGVSFFVAVGPSSSTIDKADLPLWAQGSGKKTEYDHFLEDLAARGVRTVDLRPGLNAAAQTGKVYLTHDAHWTARGALVGFDAVVEADGHPEWRIDPATALGAPAEVRGGDLARMLGVQDDVSEQADALLIHQTGTDENVSDGPIPDHVVTTGRPGPTIVVIGDSFTARYFPLMLSEHVGRVVWAHHHQCGFDWRLIDRFHPDEVWWIPTERAIVCEPGKRPEHFDEGDSQAARADARP